jgi:hypothetical protein
MKYIYKHVFIISVLVALCSCTPLSSRLTDGDYYGYEFTCNLSQSEDLEVSWYYANVLHVHRGSVALSKSPRYISHGSVIASVSDGGFPAFDGRVEELGKRTLVRLRKVSCDYCLIPLDDPLPSKIEREYVVRFLNDGSFELDGIIYHAQKNPKLE